MATEFEKGGGGFGYVGTPAPGSVLVRKPPARLVGHGASVRVAIIAERMVRQRGRTKRRSDILTELTRNTRLTAKTHRQQINSAATGEQLAYAGNRRDASVWPSDSIKFVVG